MVEGRILPFAESPLTGILYAGLYTILKGDVFWMPHSAWIGRSIFFAIFWLGGLALANRLAPHARLPVMAAIWAVLPVTSLLLENSSDALFAGLSALGLYYCLKAPHAEGAESVLWASALIGLATLTRIDGLVLFPVVAAVGLIDGIGQKRIGRYLAASIAPFTLITGFYVVLYGSAVGDFDLGLARRSDLAFRQGQGILFKERYPGRIAAFVGEAESAKLYGTPEENGYSILSTIRRNPAAYLDRFIRNIRGIPENVIEACRRSWLSLAIILLAVQGAYRLWGAGLRREVIMMGAWMLHPVIYLITFFRPGYLVLSYFVPATWAAVGLGSLFEDEKAAHARKVAAIVGVVLAAASSAQGDWRTAIILTALVLSFMIPWSIGFNKNRMAIALSLIAITLIGLSVNKVRIPDIGNSANERAVAVMHREFPATSCVVALNPVEVWAAGLNFQSTVLLMTGDVAMPEQFFSWAKRMNAAGFYIDGGTLRIQPEVWNAVQPEIGRSLKLLFNDPGTQTMLLKFAK